MITGVGRWGIAAVCSVVVALPVAPAEDPADPAVGDPATRVIDLATTLALAGENNLDLALIRQALVQARAESTAATWRFFPWLEPGFAYSARSGATQDVAGNILDVNKRLAQADLRLAAEVDLGEAIFNKNAARERVSAAEFGVDAARGDTLLAAANAYFDLTAAVAAREVAREAARIATDYEQQVARAVTIGIANRSEALKVAIEARGYAIALRQADEQRRRAAVRLAEILHLDLTTDLMPGDPAPVQLTLVPATMPVGDLVQQALDARPEIRQGLSEVAAADWLWRGARFGPLIPAIAAEYGYGGLDGRSRNSSFAWQDFDEGRLMISWRIGPGGLFDTSRIRLSESRLDQTRIEVSRLRDQVTRQVLESHESVQSARDQVEFAETIIDAALEGEALSQQRKQFGVLAVLESIAAQQQLVRARTSLIDAIIQYNKAQYALAHAAALSR